MLSIPTDHGTRLNVDSFVTASIRIASALVLHSPIWIVLVGDT
jgi:hypothetical protein